MSLGSQLERVVYCIHNSWSGYVTLFTDGKFEQHGTNSGGKWWQRGDALLLQWLQYSAEVFINVGGEYVLESVVDKTSKYISSNKCIIDNSVSDAVSNSRGFEAWTAKSKLGPTCGIIIPYRNREEHLKQLLPHLISFFHRDLQNNYINPLIVVAEQANEEKFNRGWCRNAGFLAVANACDYICLHDVDYMPSWADYSYCSFPTQIIWWGMHLRPIRVGGNSLVTAARGNLGAVVIIDKWQFSGVNGYSNLYFGWGYEDADLKTRLQVKGLTPKFKAGTFIPLEHDHQGFTETGEKTKDWIENEALFQRLAAEYESMSTFSEGLSTIAYNTISVEFERWSGFNEQEQSLVCRLRLG
jgi:hypothetical protein